MLKPSLIEKVIRHFETVGFDDLSELLYSNVILDKDGLSVEDYIPNDDDLLTIANIADVSYVGSGVSKAVFSIPEDDDVVIKIPMMGMKAYVGYPESDTEWEHSYDLRTFDGILKRGMVDSQRCDYCQREVELYSKALKAGLGRLFAKSEYLCTLYDSIPLYASESCPTNGYSISYSRTNMTNEEIDIFDHSGLDRFGVEIHIAVRVMRECGIEMIGRLYDFCKENEINDLHSGNWGINSNGELKIIDFSGFFE